MGTISFFVPASPPILTLRSSHPKVQPFLKNPSPCLRLTFPLASNRRPRREFIVRSDDGDVDSGGGDDYDIDADVDEVEELDNKKDYDVEYDRLLGFPPPRGSVDAGDASPDDIQMVHSDSFVFTQGWDFETVVDYRINEDEFHKISLLHCDFFIRKPPDPDESVYDFREVCVLVSCSSLSLFFFGLELEIHWGIFTNRCMSLLRTPMFTPFQRFLLQCLRKYVYIV